MGDVPRMDIPIDTFECQAILLFSTPVGDSGGAQLTFYFSFVDRPGFREGNPPFDISPFRECHSKLPHFVDNKFFGNSVVWLIEPKPQIMAAASLVYT